MDHPYRLRPPAAWVIDALAAEIAAVAGVFIFFRYLGITIGASAALSAVIGLFAGYAVGRILLQRLHKREDKLLPLAYGLARCDAFASMERETVLEEILRALQKTEEVPIDAQTVEILQTVGEERIPYREVLHCAQKTAARGGKTLNLCCNGFFTPQAKENAGNIAFIRVNLYDAADLAALLYAHAFMGMPAEIKGYLYRAEQMIKMQKRRPRISIARPLRLGAAGLLLAFLSTLTPFPRWYLFCSVAALLCAAWMAGRRVYKSRQAR